MRTEYVAGFLFDEYGNTVLIKKNRPSWQAGKLNGVGGHLEHDETIHEAMSREFYEETGVRFNDWKYFLLMAGDDWAVYFFRGFTDQMTLNSVKSMTDEQVLIVNWRDLYRHNVLPNLMWLVPLAHYTHDEYDAIRVDEV